MQWDWHCSVWWRQVWGGRVGTCAAEEHDMTGWLVACQAASLYVCMSVYMSVLPFVRMFV